MISVFAYQANIKNLTTMYWGKDLRKKVLSYDCKYLAELQKHNPFDIIPIENFRYIYSYLKNALCTRIFNAALFAIEKYWK